MDFPRSEEDDALVAFDPLDVVEHVLLADNLSFDRTDEGDLAFAINGDWAAYELWFAWRPEAGALQLCLALDKRVEPSHLARTYELLSMVNQRVWLGHFEMWPEDNEILFRHALPLPESERPTLAQTAAMIDAAVEAADRFYPAFDFLLTGGRTPAEAMDSCLFETVGRA
jgi:hypothetical protein